MKLQVDSITTHTVREYILRDLDASVHTYQEYMYKEYLDDNNQYVDHEIFGLPEWISMEGTETEQKILEYLNKIDPQYK